MGELFRSQTMSYGQLMIPKQMVFETIEKIGELGIVQFIDLNQHEMSFKRMFSKEIKQCEEIERKIRFFNEIITKEEERKDINGLKFKRECEIVEKVTLENLTIEIEMNEEQLKESLTNCNQIESNIEKIDETLNVSYNIDYLFKDIEGIGIGALKYIIGVIDKSKYDSFTRLIWRITRGMIVIRAVDLSEFSQYKNFVLIFQGEEMEQRLITLCTSLQCKLHSSIPIDQQERVQFQSDEMGNKQQLLNLFEESTKQKREILKGLALRMNFWKELVERHKKIYFTMNMLQSESSSTFIGECWYPSDQFETITSKLSEFNNYQMLPIFTQLEIPEQLVIPTYIKTNSFTSCFQDLTNSYGTPRYQEVNTSWLNIITFPFLFGIMFSDVGHGFILLMIAILFISFQKKLQNKQMNDIILMLFDARWLLLFMGLFSMYGGIIFNEWFGFSIDIFGTAWDTNDKVHYSRSGEDNYVYPFGVDPIWKSSNNELYFVNSLKMKLSILIGVIHMTFGIILSSLNHFKFKNWLDLFFKFIPELLFMICSFGYLSFLILFKWCSPVQENAPMLVNVFLEMFQSFGKVSEQNEVLGKSQHWIQPLLLAIIIIALLILFIPKPIFLYIQLRKKRKMMLQNESIELLDQYDQNEIYENYIPQQQFIFDIENISNENENKNQQIQNVSILKTNEITNQNEENEEGNTLIEIIIYNSIHGIEFILGCISNTASYLRLWALSLAHAELSVVFLEHVFFRLIELNVFVTTFIGFGLWAFITLGILIGMESLSSFLHTLRLHWIEFQEKFYYGDGILFTPLHF